MKSVALVVWLSLFSMGSTNSAGREGPKVIRNLRVMSAEAASGQYSRPENAVDGDPATEFRFSWANGGASLIIDLGKPYVLSGARIVNGKSDRVFWVREIEVGADRQHWRRLLGREVNLPMWRGGDTLELSLPPSVGRYARISFGGGGEQGAIGEVAFTGRENRPERHLMCWSGDIRKDFLDKLDYLDHDLGVTDLWLDYVETAFPQTNRNSGFKIWEDTGALKRFRQRDIRYWLAEHEAFTQMVNEPEDLRDDLKWETTFRQMRAIYAGARRLGFRGLVLDAEDYGGVTDAAREKYKDAADYVDAWAFADEFGPSGMYYRRGLEFGRALRQVWRCPLIQVYEARMYSGKGDCRQGNYWWLKGIHDAGVEIWIATEKTYGAGKGEIEEAEPDHVKRWFVRLAEFIPQVYKAYPFAARVLPGFHPWNTRLRQPNYLPGYLEEQLQEAQNTAQAYWLYNEGNASAGDPRDVLDAAICRRYGIASEDYLKVFSRYPTEKAVRMRKP